MSDIGPTEKEMLLNLRVIEQYLPQASTEMLQRWHGKLTTTLLKVEEELNSTMMHECDICHVEEYGYRTELPVLWWSKDGNLYCPEHEHNDIVKKEVKVDTKQTLDELMAMI